MTAEIATRARAARRLPCNGPLAVRLAALATASLLAACEGRQQQTTQGSGPVQPVVNTTPTSPPITNSGATQSEIQNAAGQPPGVTEDEQTVAEVDTGLTKAELEKGKAFINGWNGLTDEIPATVPWAIQNLAMTAETAPAPGTGGAGTPSLPGPSVSYESNIRSLLAANCTSCHRLGGSRTQSPMTTYQEAKTHAGQIVARVLAGTMPSTGPLSQADKDAFAAWKAANFAERSTVGSSQGGQGSTGGDVVFRIKAGTGNGAWNTKATEVIVPLGQRLTIYNDDTVVHQLHTNGAPCQHGEPIAPGASAVCVASQPFAGEPPLYDHGTEGRFYIRTE